MAADTNGTRNETREAEYVDLVAQHLQPCVSIYTSDCSDVDNTQCLVRLKRVLRAAESKFRNVSTKVEEVEDLLTSNWRTVEETRAPHPMAQSLAVFLSKDFFGCCHLPISVATRVAVGHQFLVRPLLAFIPAKDSFFILALSQKHVKLFEGSHLEIRERSMRDVPETFREDLEGLHFERQYQMHTASSRSAQEKGAVFHGPSIGQKDRLIHFFRDVDRGVAVSLKGEQAPLIVASVDYLFPIYKDANTYPHLVDESIDGSPDLLSLDTLRDAAWKIFQTQILKKDADALAVYHEHINTPLTSSNLREVVAAAERGLVRSLFIPPERERWGSFAPTGAVHLHAAEEPGDDELLNLAAILTLRHGGHVHVVPPGQLPEGSDLAAVFRFGFESHVAGAV